MRCAFGAQFRVPTRSAVQMVLCCTQCLSSAPHTRVQAIPCLTLALSRLVLLSHSSAFSSTISSTASMSMASIWSAEVLLKRPPASSLFTFSTSF